MSDDPRFDAWIEKVAGERVEVEARSWFVIGHSGRDGDPWKVFFESGDEQEARHFFSERVLGNGRYEKSYRSTVLTYGSPWYGQSNDSRDGGFVAGVDKVDRRSAWRAQEEREARDERRARKEARKARRRFAEVPETEMPRLRIDVSPEESREVLREHEQLAEQEAEAARPRVRFSLNTE
jgi:hypothetical protein